jgi:SAM-dependent methyltransferase
VGDAQQLPVQTAAFDVTVARLVLNFVPDAARAFAEMTRATCPDGLVTAHVWDYAAGMQVLRYFWDAATALDPAASSLEEGRRFPLCQPEALADLFRAGSLLDVAVGPLEIATTCRDFDDYWTPFLSGQGPAPSYIAALDAHGRARLQERLRASVPAKADGTISLRARTWAVCGRYRCGVSPVHAWPCRHGLRRSH